MKTIPVGRFKILVDDNNFDRIRSLRLTFAGGRVMARWGGRKDYKISLSKIIIQTDAEVVDHKDRNRFNFQVDNLRPCTQALNTANVAKYKLRMGKPMHSRYKGVTRSQGKWMSQGGPRGSGYYLGRFDSEEDAARAYDKRALASWGEFAVLNFPEL